MSLSGQLHEISAGEYTAWVSDVGAGLAGLWWGDRPVTTSWPAGVLPPMSSGAVLIPWPNRLRDGEYEHGGQHYQLPLSEPAQHNASHGLVRWVRFELADSTAESLTFTHHLVPQTGYPFELLIRISYVLAAETGLSVHTAVTNQGDRPAPLGVGFHPYLDLDGHELDHVELDVPASSMYLVDSRQIPIETVPVAGTPYQLSPARALGTLRLDHGFTGLHGQRAVIRFGSHTTQLWWGAEFGYLQVFTPPLERFKRTAIAIEPMSCAANALQSGDGLTVLEPAASWTATWGIASGTPFGDS
jgi:aldose 1-epimerase